MRFFLLSIVLCLVLAGNAFSMADSTEVDEDVPENLRFFKEKYELKVNEPFEIVWKAIKLSLESFPCAIQTEVNRQNDEGLYQGTIKSDFCMLAYGPDTTKETLSQYSYKLPVIMGGVWYNGRIQFTYIVKEQKDGSVNLLLKSELSGLENYVTNEVHFWQSNGKLEHQMLEKIKSNVPVAKQKK